MRAFCPALTVLRRWLTGVVLGVVLAGATDLSASFAACPPVSRGPIEQTLQDDAHAARDRGFLWRLSKHGRSAYLYGTLHIGKPDWTVPGPRVRAALRAADTLALEVDLGDPALLDRLRSLMAALPGTPSLPAALRARIARQAAAACLPETSLEALHPVMQVTTLTVLAARWDGLDPSHGQEGALTGLARSAGKAVVSLESPELQMAVLIPSDPAQVLEWTAQSVDQLERGAARRTMRRMAQAWERSLLDDLGRYEQWCECVLDDDDRATLHRLNDERNPNLAERIDALHAQGKIVFAAVGALHMTGAQSLPLLMARRGYTVERIAFAPM